jgi:hypothetical protein
MNLEFSNGWTVQLDDTISHNYSSNSNYNTYHQFNSAPITVHNPTYELTKLQNNKSIAYYVDYSDSDNQDFFYISEYYSKSQYNFNNLRADTDLPYTDLASFLDSLINVENGFSFRHIDRLSGTSLSGNTTLTSVSSVPVPPSLWLMLTGIVGLVFKRR